jgi:hypothetical protein
MKEVPKLDIHWIGFAFPEVSRFSFSPTFENISDDMCIYRLGTVIDSILKIIIRIGSMWYSSSRLIF